MVKINADILWENTKKTKYEEVFQLMQVTY